MLSDSAALSGAVYECVDTARPDDFPYMYFEFMPADRSLLPALSLQTLTGDPVLTRFMDGSYIGQFRFAVYLRMSADDDESRLAASALMEQVTSVVAGGTYTLPTGFDYHRITQDTLPRLISVDEGFYDYQVTFAVDYGKKKG